MNFLSFSLRKRTLNFVLAAILVYVSAAHFACADSRIRGAWTLNVQQSDELQKQTKLLNDKLNAERREREYRKDPRQKKSSSRNRFQATADAVEAMIREDSRSLDWSISSEIQTILDCDSIKLYQSDKVVVMYGQELKRLLRINPAGRAFSVSGQEITEDGIGRSLTFVEKGELIIETRPFDGGKLIERYSLDSETGALLQKLEVLEREGGPKLEMSRYFDPS